MSRSINRKTATISLLAGCGVILFAGCEVSKNDVDSARQKAAEEVRETEEVRRAGEEKVREAQAELEAARHDATRVPFEGGKEDVVKEKEKELAEAKTELTKNVAKEKQEAQAAIDNADKVARQLQATQERDTYVKDAKSKLQQVDRRLQELEVKKSGLAGDLLQDLQAQVELLEGKREIFNDAIDQLNSGDVTQWEVKHALVEQAWEQIEDDNAPNQDP